MISNGQGALPLGKLEQGDLVTYRFTIPGVPPSKNAYDNMPEMWRGSMKAKWVQAVMREVEAQDMPRHVTRIGLAATLVFPDNRKRDPQNYVPALWNWIPDGLQYARVIDDDRDGMIDFGRNLGIRFAVDDRKRLSREARKRTHIAVTMRLPH